MNKIIQNILQTKKAMVIIILLILFFIILSGAILYNAKKDVYTFPIYSKNLALEGVEIQTIIEYEPAYIAVHYPAISSQKINNIIYDMIMKKLNSFKLKISGKKYEGQKPEFNITFDTYRYKFDLISFRFNIYQMFSNQLDSSNEEITMTFDLSSEKQISNKNLFVDGRYLNLFSEKTYYNIINTGITKTEKVVILKEDIDKLKGKKLIALTYDDGPHKEYTPELLDVLKEEDAKATFFILGSRAEYYPEIIQRLVAEGHQIGNHSFSHKQFITLSNEKLQFEINETNNVLKEITGETPRVIRTPYGEVTSKIRQTVNMPIILWDIDTLDWRAKSADRVYNSIISKVQDGDIILMHDIFPVCVQATKKVIEKLKGEGYVFVTVETLITAREGKMENGKVYRFVR